MGHVTAKLPDGRVYTLGKGQVFIDIIKPKARRKASTRPRRTKAFRNWLWWYGRGDGTAYDTGFLQGLMFGLDLKGEEEKIANALRHGLLTR